MSFAIGEPFAVFWVLRRGDEENRCVAVAHERGIEVQTLINGTVTNRLLAPDAGAALRMIFARREELLQSGWTPQRSRALPS
jgi:hypothetical protein